MTKLHMPRLFMIAAILCTLAHNALAQMDTPSDSSMTQPMAEPMAPPPQPVYTTPAYNAVPNRPVTAPQPGVLGTLNSQDMGYGNAPPAQQPVPMVMPPRPMPSQAADITPTLQPMQNGQIKYITGGIGDEERASLKAMEKDYNLHIVSAGKTGEFMGDTQIIISSARGDQVLSSIAGPIFFANLPDGQYVVKASCNNQTKQQAVSIRNGKIAHIHLSW